MNDQDATPNQLRDAAYADPDPSPSWPRLPAASKSSDLYRRRVRHGTSQSPEDDEQVDRVETGPNCFKCGRTHPMDGRHDKVQE